MIESLSRPTIRQQPRSANVARSPLRSHPPARSVSADFSGMSSRTATRRAGAETGASRRVTYLLVVGVTPAGAAVADLGWKAYTATARQANPFSAPKTTSVG
jgi:hypothetical protein